jgi:hypothetical protein
LEELKEVLKALEKPFNKKIIKLGLSQGPENSHPCTEGDPVLRTSTSYFEVVQAV